MKTLSRLFVWVWALSATMLITGCASLEYYALSVRRHLSVLNSARPVSDWLADLETPRELRERLMLAQRMRNFAVSELHLPDNASYRRYADLKRSSAVWNVVAAPELSLTLKTWCVPVAGCVGYRGYFDRAGAQALAAELRLQDLEVYVYGVPAYSTLGKLPGAYFSDPLLNTFIGDAEADLAALIFHELAHQVAFAPGDTSFNESFATAVERIGSRRWLSLHAQDMTQAAAARVQARRASFRSLTLKARRELNEVYRSDQSEPERRRAKAEILARMRAEHAALKAGAWEGYAGYDAWFANANNASLAVLGAYDDLVPQFEALFMAQGHDFKRFYAEVRRIAQLPAPERRVALAR